MNFDFVKHRKTYFILSSVLTVIGILSLILFQLNLGIDFKSGTRLEIQTEQTLNEKEIKSILKPLNLTPKEITFNGNENETGVVRFSEALTKEEIAKAKDSFKEKYRVEPNISTVSPTVGKELVKNALYALSIASIGIILYVAVRFDFRKSIATIVAMIHDVFIVITVFSLFQIEIDLTFIAAILTIVGYSINDTIVNFDRIRDNLKTEKKAKTFEDLAYIVNLSLNQTLTRSINTGISVLLAAIALMIFGSESIRAFSLSLVLGLFVGTYSSLFIASQLWLVWETKKLEKQKKTELPEQLDLK